MRGALLGPRWNDTQTARELAALGAVSTELEESALLDRVAALLAEGAVVGWFQGRMEFGPRALGARSILGDPRNPEMQRRMNLKIKMRESFRPFAPAVLAEEAAGWFDLDGDSPYMLVTAPVRAERRLAVASGDDTQEGLARLAVPRSMIPAVTHVDYSARVQTVDRETHPRFHALLARFHALTGCPMLVNTSFNQRGEPIVCTPRDAYRCFLRTGIDWLVVERHLLDRAAQPPWTEPPETFDAD